MKLALKTSLATIAIALIGTTGMTAPAQASWEHFSCYKIDPHGKFKPRDVRLEDQFARYAAHVVRPVMLCNPVDKNGEGIRDKERHLVCYEIKADPAGKAPKAVDVVTENQFQEQGMTAVLPPDILCVPSKKRHKR